MKRELAKMVIRLGSLVVVAVSMVGGAMAVERTPASALDCSWQSPSSFVANYEVTAQSEYSLRAQPFVGCEPIGAIFAGQTARVVAETDSWRYLQIHETGRWGWVHKGAFESQPPPGRGCAGNQEMVVVAHADDDIIFMNPTIDDRVRAGRCVVTVYVTAGDAGQDETYWSSREDGAGAAHARMEGIPATGWSDATLSVNGRSLAALERPSGPGSELVFLRLPDGFQGNGPLPGPGSERYGFQSLQKLWSGEIASIAAVDGSASYSRQALIDTLAELIDDYNPSVIHVQDHSNQGNRSDHSDHIHAARFAVEARNQATANPAIADYLGYGTSGLAINVHGADKERKYDIFDQYALHDPLVHHPTGLANPISGAYTHSWLPREYRLGQGEPAVRVLATGFLIGVGDSCLRANGNQVNMSDCFNVASQRWQLLSDGKLRGLGDRCLDVVGGGRESGTKLQMFSCVDVAAQEWILMDDGRLIGHPGNCLDVVNGRTDNGAEVQMFSCVGVAAQKWRLSPDLPPGGPTVIRSGFLVGAGGNCLDVINGRTNNQAEVQMYDCVDVRLC